MQRAACWARPGCPTPPANTQNEQTAATQDVGDGDEVSWPDLKLPQFLISSSFGIFGSHWVFVTGRRDRAEQPEGLQQGALWSHPGSPGRDFVHWDSTSSKSLIPLPTLDFLNGIWLEKGNLLANEKLFLVFWMNVRLWGSTG